MNLTSDQIKAILTVAQTLQRNYDILGAPATQNVRNPYPLHKLVIGVLPTRKTKRMTSKEIQKKLCEYGYRVPTPGLVTVLVNLRKRGAISADALTEEQRRNKPGSAGNRALSYWYPAGS